MGNMLKFELRRLLKKPVFYIMLGLCVGVAIFYVFSTRENMNYMIENMSDIVSDYDYGYEKSWVKERFVEYLSPQRLVLSNFWLMLPSVLAIFTAIFVCEDRARGTIKNIYARGYSRTNVFFSKFIVSSAVSAVLYLLVVGALYISGTIAFLTAPFDVSPQTVKGFWLLVLGRLILMLAINAGYFMLSELIGGNTGFSIASNMFAPSIMNGILYLGLSFFFYVILKDLHTDNKYAIIQNIIEYWIYSLTMEGFNIEMKPDAYVWHIIASAIYLIVFTGLGWLIAVKKEVKN